MHVRTRPEPPQIPPEFLDPANALHLALLAALCHESYQWTKPTLHASVHLRDGIDPVIFERKSGSPLWRLAALVYMPLSYGVLLASFGSWLILAAVIAILVSIAAVDLLGLDWPIGASVWFAAKWLAIVVAALSLALAAAALGLAVELLFKPHFASAKAFGFRDRATGQPVIIFAGSRSYRRRRDDVFINASVWPLLWPTRHLGFHRAWRHIAPDVTAWLRAMPDRKPIVLAGHSLGGALAQVAAYDLSPHFAIAEILSLGSSRIGSAATRRRYRDRPHLAAITNQVSMVEDSIPRLPPALFFKHVGNGHLLDAGGTLRPGRQSTLIGDYMIVVGHRLTASLHAMNVKAGLWPKPKTLRMLVPIAGGFESPAGSGRYPATVTAMPALDAEPPDFATELRLTLQAVQRYPALAPKLAALPLAAIALIIAYGLRYYVVALQHGLTTGHSHGRYADALAARAARFGFTLPSEPRATGSA